MPAVSMSSWFASLAGREPWVNQCPVPGRGAQEYDVAAHVVFKVAL
jgi:hypothetical protein